MKPSLAADWKLASPLSQIADWLSPACEDLEITGGQEAVAPSRHHRVLLYLPENRYDKISLEGRQSARRRAPLSHKELHNEARRKVAGSPLSIFVFQFLPTILVACSVVLVVVGGLNVRGMNYAAAFSVFTIAVMSAMAAFITLVTYSRLKQEWRRRLEAKSR